METVGNLKPCIEQVSTPEKLAHAAFDSFLNDARIAIESRGKFNVALSGGHTPERFFELLGDRPDAESIDWNKVEVFWVDERCVPPDAKESNYGLAEQTFLSKVNIPPANIHRMSGRYNLILAYYSHRAL